MKLYAPRPNLLHKHPINASRLKILAGYGVKNNAELQTHWMWDNAQGPEPAIAEEVQPALKYGNFREEDALVSVMEEVKKRLSTRGALNIRVLQVGIVRPAAPADTMKATPDFLVQYTSKDAQKKYIVIEIKCPYYGVTGTMGTADMACRPYYLLQTHAQMAGVRAEWGVDVEGAILYSWSPTGMTSFPIAWNATLWSRMVNVIEDWHSRTCPPTTSDPLRTLLRSTCASLAPEATSKMRTHTALFSVRHHEGTE